MFISLIISRVVHNELVVRPGGALDAVVGAPGLVLHLHKLGGRQILKYF